MVAIMRACTSSSIAGLLVSSITSVYAQISVDDSAILGFRQRQIPIQSPNSIWFERHACPPACHGNEPDRWKGYSSIVRLAACIEPVLFDFATQSVVRSKRRTIIRACTLRKTTSTSQRPPGFHDHDGPETAGQPQPHIRPGEFRKCPEQASGSQVAATLSRIGPPDAKANNVLFAVNHLQEILKSADCKTTEFFTYDNGSIAGIYVGSGIDKRSVAPLLTSISEDISTHGAATHIASQLCDRGRTSRHILGVSISSQGNLAAVKSDVRAWMGGECASARGATLKLPPFELRESK